MDWKKLEEDFNKALDSDEYWDNLKMKKDIAEKRYDKFEEYLKNNDFEELLDRLINEHSDSYIDKCYKNGYEPHPNNKLYFLMSYFESRLNSIETPEWIESSFPTTAYYFKGYYFSNTFGQGTITEVHDSTQECLISL